MRRLWLLLMVAVCSVAHATTYTVNSGMSVGTLNSTFATAAGSSGNTVQFTAGTYPVGAYTTPCTNGVIYQGVAITEPNIGNTPSVIIPGRGIGSYSFSVPSNGLGNTSYTSGCQFKYLQFSGLGGAIFVNYPWSGINLQYNYFTGNDGTPSCPAGSCSGPGGNSQGFSNAVQTVFFNGNCPGGGGPNTPCGANLGGSWAQIDSNVWFNQCRTIRNVGYDAQGSCSAVWFSAHSDHTKLTNNIIDGTEEGFKWNLIYYQISNVMASIDVENNLCRNNSRICMESQQNTDGNAIFSHNSYYLPGGGLSVPPGFPTFELSIPLNTTNPAATINDNVFATGQACVQANCGIGLEVGGQGMNGQHNVFLNNNSCAANNAVWLITMFSNNAQESWTNNYFSGCRSYNGTPNNVGNAFTVEAGAVLGNATLNPNTVVQTSVNLVTQTPVISPNGGSFAGPVTVTLSPPDTIRKYSIFYTTDGSTPATFLIGSSAGTSQVYTTPFVVPLGTTVKALAQWGQGGNQGISFAPYFGFVPSSVTSQTYSSGGTVTLQTVTVSSTAGSTIQVGGTLQLAAICHYSDGSTTSCNTLDIHGNVVTGWNSTNGNVTINSSGLATGQAIGTANTTATVTGGIVSSPAFTVTVSAGPLTLASISLGTTGGVNSITAGSTNQLLATCHYSDGSTTPCNTMDSHGNNAAGYASSTPASATVNASGGLVSGVTAGSTNLTASVTPAPSMLGTNNFSLAGTGTTGFINESYSVTGTSAGNYQPGTCNIYMPPTSWTAGSLWTCIIVLAPTPTTQNASALCSASYTTTGTSWPGGFLPPISMASCPALSANQGYWIGSTTNLPQSNPAQGFWQCSGGCNGGVPTFGAGTYPYRYAANAFGNYTNLPTTLTSDGAIQVVQYVTLTTTPVNSANLPLSVTGAPPSLASAYLAASSNTMTVGSTMQMAAKCHYSSGPDQDCTVADIYGDAVSMWASSDPTKATVGNVGSASPGLVTAISSSAQVINAASCSSADVQTAFNAATASTTTINIPACAGGTAWTTAVTFNVPSGSTNLTVIGAGSQSIVGGNDQTVIIDNVNHSGLSYALQINTAGASSILRLSGITLKQNGSSTPTTNGILQINGSSQQVRVDHYHCSLLANIGGNSSICGDQDGWQYGVWDHNLFDLQAGSVNNGIRVGMSSYNSQSFGNGSWNDVENFGTGAFIFFENNTFNGGAADDCNDGGRIVFRHNTLNESFFQGHEMENDIRGCRAVEVYSNTYANSSGGIVEDGQAVDFRMGTGLVWGNVVSGASTLVAMNNDRTNSGHGFAAPPASWGYCGTSLGPSNWDQNGGASGYACIDQVGRGKGDLLSGVFPNKCDATAGCPSVNGTWPGNALVPIYQWMDQLNPVSGFTMHPCFADDPTTIAINRDYYCYTLTWNGTAFTGTAFNGTVGTGSGLAASKPGTCTTGVAYWGTDTSTLYKCAAANTWTPSYTPFTYPHPLVSGPSSTVTITATIYPSSITSSGYPITVTNAAVTLTGISLSTAGGVTGLFVGSTNQLKATCTYSDMSSLDCTNTDAHGNKANTYLSTMPSHATIGSTTGLVSGVAPGTTTFTAHAGSFTSSALPLTVLSVPSGIYTITIRGPVGFSGTVRF